MSIHLIVLLLLLLEKNDKTLIYHNIFKKEVFITSNYKVIYLK